MEKKQQGVRRYILSLQILLLSVLMFGTGVLFGSEILVSQAQGGNTTLSEEMQESFAPLFQAYNLIQQQYIDDIETDQLVDGAINGMVESLEDEYSNYVDPEFFDYMDENLSGQIEGIGTTIEENEDGLIQVVNVLPNTPAERAGVQVGDIFLRVNGEDVTELNTLELVTKVRGPSGTVVDITFMRGEEEVTYSLERAPIQIPNIEVEMLEGNIAYIKMANFTSLAREQVDDAVASLDLETTDGLIFDLRDNPGGFLTTATEIAGLFLKDGVILVEEFGNESAVTFSIRDGEVLQTQATGETSTYSTNARYYAFDFPVVVLVNERSASASELVAGAWQDNGVATIVGETTFGKGSVQLQNTLINGGGLRLTVARWLTPNGTSISQVGVVPDIMVVVDEEMLEADEDPQLDAALEFLRTGVIPAQPEPNEVEAEGAAVGE